PMEIPDLPAVPELPEMPEGPVGLRGRRRFVTGVEVEPVVERRPAAVAVARKPLGEEILS
ncbi:unnamed protein product, partial [marine sediment metagenome]